VDNLTQKRVDYMRVFKKWTPVKFGDVPKLLAYNCVLPKSYISASERLINPENQEKNNEKKSSVEFG